jgi:hypothetical protein
LKHAPTADRFLSFVIVVPFKKPWAVSTIALVSTLGRPIRPQLEHPGEVQLTDRRYGRLPSALGAQPADTRILIRLARGFDACCAHGFRQHNGGVVFIWHTGPIIRRHSVVLRGADGPPAT